MNSGDNVDLGTNLAWRVLSRPKQCAFQLALNMYLKVADHSFGGTSSSPTAAEYELATRKAVSCGSSELQEIGIVPEQHAGPIDAPSISKN